MYDSRNQFMRDSSVVSVFFFLVTDRAWLIPIIFPEVIRIWPRNYDLIDIGSAIMFSPKANRSLLSCSGTMFNFYTSKRFGQDNLFEC